MTAAARPVLVFELNGPQNPPSKWPRRQYDAELWCRGGISGWQQGDGARKVEVERKCARKKI